jgi:hypothetical protein
VLSTASEIAGGAGVHREVVLRGFHELAVLPPREDGRARQLERPHDVLERRAQEPRLLPLDGEVAHERDQRAEEAVGSLRERGARVRRERGSAFGRCSHGEQ